MSLGSEKMKKLNNNGWGLVTFIIFIVIFIICLIISAIGFRYIGLLDEDWHFVNFSDIARVKEETETRYRILEERMTDATKKYILDFYNEDLGVDTLHIKVSTLKDNGYLSNFTDSKDRDCSGYTSVYKSSNTIIYEPYLKCKNYKTSGYVSRRDD